MLLTLIFTFTVSPMLLVDLLSHFSYDCSEKNKEQRLICFSFRIYENHYVAQTSSCDPLIFLSYRSNPANFSKLMITTLVNDQYFKHKIEYMLIRNKHNHDKKY